MKNKIKALEERIRVVEGYNDVLESLIDDDKIKMLILKDNVDELKDLIVKLSLELFKEE